MRAIGQRSLASILAMGLHIARIILTVMMVGIVFTMFLMPFVPQLATMFADMGDVEITSDISGHIRLSAYFSVAHTFATTAVTLFVVNRLLEILKTLRESTPFVKENADRFRAVGYALLIGEGAKFAFGFFSMIFRADIDINSSFISWLAIIAVFVLAEVFREGARMKEEQDLTV